MDNRSINTFIEVKHLFCVVYISIATIGYLNLEENNWCCRGVAYSKLVSLIRPEWTISQITHTKSESFAIGGFEKSRLRKKKV